MVTPIDTAWDDRLKAIMPANFMNNTSTNFTANAGFLDNMINRIGRTFIYGQNNAINPFGDWTDAVMDYGDTIQKYCLPYIKGTKPDYDPANPNPYKTVKTKPEVQYITFNDDVQYKVTVNNYKLKEAFTSESTFGSFVAEITNSMYNSAGIDMYTKWVKYLSKTDYLGTDSKVDLKFTAGKEDEYAFSVLDKLKELVTKDLRYPTTGYNKAAMLSASANFDVVMTIDTKNMIDKALAGVYNLEKLDIPNVTFKYVNDFASVEGMTGKALDAIVLSKGMAHYTPKTPESGALYNPENYYTNMWYKEAGMFGFDPFFGCAQIYKTTA